MAPPADHGELTADIHVFGSQRVRSVRRDVDVGWTPCSGNALVPVKLCGILPRRAADVVEAADDEQRLVSNRDVGDAPVGAGIPARRFAAAAGRGPRRKRAETPPMLLKLPPTKSTGPAAAIASTVCAACATQGVKAPVTGSTTATWKRGWPPMRSNPPARHTPAAVRAICEQEVRIRVRGRRLNVATQGLDGARAVTAHSGDRGEHAAGVHGRPVRGKRVHLAVCPGFQGRTLPVRRSTAARLARGWPPTRPKMPPRKTVSPTPTTSRTVKSVSGFHGSASPSSKSTAARLRRLRPPAEVKLPATTRESSTSRRSSTPRTSGDVAPVTRGFHSSSSRLRVSMAPAPRRGSPSIRLNSPPSTRCHRRARAHGWVHQAAGGSPGPTYRRPSRARDAEAASWRCAEGRGRRPRSRRHRLLRWRTRTPASLEEPHGGFRRLC